MKVLVIGGGGREHAIIWSLKSSKKISKIYAIGGNAGISELATCISGIGVMEFDKIVEFTKAEKIDYVIVAPDNPLAEGLVNVLNENKIKAFGPTKEAALIESSKAFSKNLMKKYNIPTANYMTFDDYGAAEKYLKTCSMPIVLKADGLALGKGVLICENLDDALSGLKQIMLDKQFGDAGNKVIVEEFLTGEEVSVLTFTDGNTITPMITSCDHKRVFDGDKGLNTGGMGAFSPCPFYTESLAAQVEKEILVPTMDAMNEEGRTFKGVLYFGLIVKNGKAKVIEYNARFGDPETQAVLPMLKTDLLDIMLAVTDGRLKDVKIEWNSGACICVMLSSGGYPEKFEKGKKIHIEKLDTDTLLFHSGTAFDGAGNLITAGGRVLGVTAASSDLNSAREKVYSEIKKITFDKMHYRKDIGLKYTGEKI